MGSPCRILCLDARESLPDCIDDNLAMESAVLDENPTTVHTRKSRASDIETRHVRLKPECVAVCQACNDQSGSTG